MSRVATNKLIELAEEGVIDWQTIAMECLAYMSEAEVRDMDAFSELFEDEDEDDD